jgi:hypothetical protein
MSPSPRNWIAGILWLICGCLHPAWAQIRPAPRPVAVLPFTYDGLHIFIKGIIHPYDQDTLNFIFDSGCEMNILDASYAALWKLTASKKAGISGLADGMTYLPVLDLPELQLGEAHLQRPSFYIEDLKDLRSPLGRVDGILGYPLIAAYTVMVDYDHHRLVLYRPGPFPYSKKGQVLQMRMNFYTPVIQASLPFANGNTLKSLYHVTLGGNYGVMFNFPYVRKYRVDEAFLQHTGELPVKDMLKTIDYFNGILNALIVGRYHLRNVPGSYSPDVDDGNPDVEIAGAIGNEVWRQFNLIFNLSQHELYLEPNSQFGR